MSYILDALKKSEQKRNRGNVPTLQTSSRAVFGQRSLWLGIVIGMASLLVVAGAAWLINARWFQSAAPGATETAAESRVPESASGAATASASTSASVAPAEPEAAPAPEPAAEAIRVDSVDQMDANARARLEELSLNVVSYSETPARRFVMLNQRIVRESGTVGDNVVVKRIMPGEALLRVGDYEILVSPQ